MPPVKRQWGGSHQERAELRAKVAKHCQKHTLEHAAQKFGVSMSLARSACKEHGVTPVRPKSSRVTTVAQSRLKLIAAFVNSKTSYASLARKHGVTRQAVEQFATRCIAAGIPVLDRAA